MSNFENALTARLYVILQRYVPADKRVACATELAPLFGMAVEHGSDLGASAALSVTSDYIDSGRLVDAAKCN